MLILGICFFIFIRSLFLTRRHSWPSKAGDYLLGNFTGNCIQLRQPRGGGCSFVIVLNGCSRRRSTSRAELREMWGLCNICFQSLSHQFKTHLIFFFQKKTRNRHITLIPLLRTVFIAHLSCIVFLLLHVARFLDKRALTKLVVYIYNVFYGLKYWDLPFLRAANSRIISVKFEPPLDRQLNGKCPYIAFSRWI